MGIIRSMEFSYMNISNYMYVYRTIFFYKRVNITELSDFRKHWIPATPKDTTMSFGASPTVCWRKKAWSMVTLCLSSESVIVKSNQLFIDSKSLWLFVGDHFLWISLVTHTHQFVRDAPVTHQKYELFHSILGQLGYVSTTGYFQLL